MPPKKNTRISKIRTRDAASLNDHNRDTAKFWKDSNHRRKRRKSNKAFRELVELVDKGVVNWYEPDRDKSRLDKSNRQSRDSSRYVAKHTFSVGDSWPSS